MADLGAKIRSRQQAKTPPVQAEAMDSGGKPASKHTSVHLTEDDLKAWKVWAANASASMSTLALASMDVVRADPALRAKVEQAAKDIDDERSHR